MRSIIVKSKFTFISWLYFRLIVYLLALYDLLLLHIMFYFVLIWLNNLYAYLWYPIVSLFLFLVWILFWITIALFVSYQYRDFYLLFYSYNLQDFLNFLMLLINLYYFFHRFAVFWVFSCSNFKIHYFQNLCLQGFPFLSPSKFR